MGVKLRITAGPSSATSSQSIVSVNSDISAPLRITSDVFDGYITVRILDWEGNEAGSKPSPESGYFQKKGGNGCSWSVQVQGRFLKEIDADDLVYGNIFDKPIRESLPWGTSAVIKFVQWIDPPLQQDLKADQPWAWSPLFATMNYISVRELSEGEEPKWDTEQPDENCSCLSEGLGPAINDPSKRRKWFGDESKRKSVKIGKDHLVTTDFCNGFINFNNLSLKIPAIKTEIPLAKYWDGQPVRYVCRTRDGTDFWCVTFDIVDEDVLKERHIDPKAQPSSSTEEGPAGTKKPNGDIDEDQYGVD